MHHHAKNACFWSSLSVSPWIHRTTIYGLMFTMYITLWYTNCAEGGSLVGFVYKLLNGCCLGLQLKNFKCIIEHAPVWWQSFLDCTPRMTSHTILINWITRLLLRSHFQKTCLFSKFDGHGPIKFSVILFFFKAKIVISICEVLYICSTNVITWFKQK